MVTWLDSALWLCQWHLTIFSSTQGSGGRISFEKCIDSRRFLLHKSCLINLFSFLEEFHFQSDNEKRVFIFFGYTSPLLSWQLQLSHSPQTCVLRRGEFCLNPIRDVKNVSRTGPTPYLDGLVKRQMPTEIETNLLNDGWFCIGSLITHSA